MKQLFADIMLDCTRYKIKRQNLLDLLIEGLTYKATLPETDVSYVVDRYCDDKRAKYIEPLKIVKKFPRFVMVERRNGYRECIGIHDLMYYLPDGAELWQ
jgi:hypothetical protein